MRAWPQEKLQGMARRSSIRRDARRKRDASRYSIRRFPRSRRGEEKVDESWRLIDERAVGSHAQARQRRGGVEKILGSGTDRCKKRCFERRGHKRLEIVQADVGFEYFDEITSPCSVSLM